MKKIIYTRFDGGLSVVHPARNTYPKIETLSDDEILQRAMDRLPPDAIDVQIVEEDSIPKDRTFREAWKSGKNRVEICMDKSREIHKNTLREFRKPLLHLLDVKFIKAIESKDDDLLNEVIRQKQILRDVTKHPSLAQANTPDELKQVWPFDKDILNATN